MNHKFVKVIVSLLAIFSLTSANALLIRVSQESAAGAGDFDANVLGNIASFDTALSISAFYDYGNPDGASYNGQLNGGPDTVSGMTQIFLHNGSDGVSLVVVHDRANDGSGGNTRTQWVLAGDTATFGVIDDPGEGVGVFDGNTRFVSSKVWFSCCTDGYTIGALDGNWSMIGGFLAAPTGINSLQATSANNANIALDLSTRRVRLDLAPTISVAEPGMLTLALLGLAGLGVRRVLKR